MTTGLGKYQHIAHEQIDGNNIWLIEEALSDGSKVYNVEFQNPIDPRNPVVFSLSAPDLFQAVDAFKSLIVILEG